MKTATAWYPYSIPAGPAFRWRSPWFHQAYQLTRPFFSIFNKLKIRDSTECYYYRINWSLVSILLAHHFILVIGCLVHTSNRRMDCLVSWFCVFIPVSRFLFCFGVTFIEKGEIFIFRVKGNIPPMEMELPNSTYRARTEPLTIKRRFTICDPVTCFESHCKRQGESMSNFQEQQQQIEFHFLLSSWKQI